jgi:phage terminase Nu1 subunit (DNA packaging protein)
MGSKGNCTIVDRAVIAEEFNITARRVNQLVGIGLPRAARGKYPVEKCRRWYIRYLQKCLERDALVAEGGESGRAFVRLRREIADAELKEIEVAKARKEMIAISDFEKTLSDLVSTVKAQILGVAPRVASKLVGLDSRLMAQAIIEKYLKAALAALATASKATRQKA